MNYGTLKSIAVPLLAALSSLHGLAQTKEAEENAIKALIQDAYVGGVYNDDNTEAMKNGFHEKSTVHQLHHENLTIFSLKQWTMQIDRMKAVRPTWNNRTTAEIAVIGLEGNAAVARVDISNNNVPETTDFLSLYKFDDGWKITNRIFARHPHPPEVHRDLIDEWEKSINASWNPPEKVIEAIGVEPGMLIGEVGAGRGRYTLPLAQRVGNTGKVYSNDINKDSLAVIRERCQANGISNVETVLGKEDDPLLPKEALDMVLMVWVFHHLDNPTPLLKNLKPSLKPGAPLVIVGPKDSEIDLEREAFGQTVEPGRPTLRERIEAAALEAGFELRLIRVESFLPGDDIYILKAVEAAQKTTE
jgi:SAM-dependent methyltransferase